MARTFVLVIVPCVASLPMAPTVRGAPPGGVAGLSFFFPTWDHSSVVFVGAAGAAGVA